ncbi:MAG: DUF1090 domain-containing protein [Campylobacteraceae bacterium]
MKKIVFLGITAALLSNFLYAQDAKLKGCALKQDRIEKELAYAKEYNHKDKIKGLEEALENAKKYCTDDSLKKDLQKDVKEREDELKKAKAELEEAKVKGKSDKIEKREEKIKKAEYKLEEAKKELKDTF